MGDDEHLERVCSAAVSFERLARSDGGAHWLATDLMGLLGYESFTTFQGAIDRAIVTCTTLRIPVLENVVPHTTVTDGVARPDYKLSRFACLLVSMNADVRQPAVAAVQAYLAALAQALHGAEDIERVQVRDRISEHERCVSSAAGRAGVVNFGFVQNAGYRGMYNMSLGELKQVKALGTGARSLLDFMGKRELAGNLFRLTETEARLRSRGLVGQRPAERIALDVGRQVRRMMIESDGVAPERLPLARDIKQVQSELKQTAKEFRKVDAGGNELPPASE
jgi:DNA-damage-inducible protein D